MDATEVWAEGGSRETVVINTTDFSTDHIAHSLTTSHPEIASLIRWSENIQSRRGGLGERDKFLTPNSIFDQMRVAQEAAEVDDVVAGVLETTEALSFNKMSVQSDDQDEENIWNQIIEDIELDARIREMWREMFTVSQFYAAVWWDVKDYKVKGRSAQGVQRKKQFSQLKVPTSMTLLDPLKITPVGNFMFNQEQLAWIATRQEATLYDNVLSGREEDETVKRLIVGPYEPSVGEQGRLGKMGIGAASQLYLLNPENVWRLTATRSQYKPFADVRMKSIFELLDLKHLLRELDRTMLLGATHFILVIKKGSEHMPAKNEELASLQASVRTLSRIPVIVSDHRLEIEIVTPKIDMSLQPEKYNTLDARITARLYQLFMSGNFASGAKGDDSIKLLRMVSRGLEARRSQIRHAVERRVLQEIYNRNEQITQEPSLQFHPKSIAIDFDPGLAAYILDLLDRKHISRGTALEQIDLDEDEEARRKTREAEFEDDIFHSLTPLQDPEQQHGFQKDILNQQQKLSLQTLEKQAELAPTPVVPAATPSAAPVKKKPANADPKSAGRSGGGNRSGGGKAPGTGQGEPKDPRRGAKG